MKIPFTFAAAFLTAFIAPALLGADDYVLGPDSKKQEGVPQGEITKYTFADSKIFPGTWREYWVYVPKQYDPAKPACVFVCQDGIQYNAPTVFDNLIAKKEMPVTIGVFIMHGKVRALDTNSALDRFNRSYEYDGLGDNYARFVLEEILPDVEKKTTSDGRAIKLSTNGNDRATGGASSGAICAFTAAWERPDAFRRVFSSVGTFVGLRGGNDYPTLIRKTEPKPIRVFLQDGSGDLNIYGGDWWMANQEMERALVFAGYEVNHIWGDGGHNGKHAGAIFPDAMRWLWKDWPAEIKAGNGSQQLKEILIPGEGWQLVSSGHRFTEGPAVNNKGEVFFTDIPNNRIHKVALDGKVTVFAENTGGANGLMFRSDGKLYACANGKKAITAYDEDGNVETIVEDVESNDLVSLPKNGYFTDPGNKRVWFVDENGEKSIADTGIARPNGIVTSPDQSLLYVADTAGQFVYSFQIQPDGKLQHKQRYFHLHLADGSTQSGADGMTVDRDGRLYVATDVGLQVCDQAGRVNVIVPKPQKAWLSNVVFGGPNLDELYVTCGDKVFKRKTHVKGLIPSQASIKPKAPRL